MAILTNPPAKSSIYKPVMWQAGITTTEAEVQNAVVTVSDASGTLQTFRLPWRTKTGPTAGDYFYIFDIDIQSILQDIMLPNLSGLSTTLDDVDSSGSEDLDESFFRNQVNISVTYEYVDAATNQITDLGITDVGSEILCLAVTFRQSYNGGAWFSFMEDLFLSNGTNIAKLFTDCVETDICRDDTAIAGFCYNNTAGPTTNCIVVETDDGGKDCYYLSTSTKYAKFATGCGQFDALPWLRGNPVTALTKSYIVYPAYTDGDGYFIQTHKAIKYNIIPKNEKRYLRLVWLNNWGNMDSISFVGGVSKIRKESVITSERPLDFVPGNNGQNIQQRGKYLSDISQSYGYHVQRTYFKNEYAALLNSLFSSPEVYIVEKDPDTGASYMIPVVITDRSEAEYQNGNKWYVNMDFRLWAANDLITQKL